jgi:MFS family permease
MGNNASLVIGACIVGPQIIVACLSPAVGRAAERFGRRRVLAAGMLALPVRALLLAALASSGAMRGAPLIVVQLLDGVSGAAFGVLLPLISSDIAQAGGRFNLCMGVLGLAIGGAAALSTTVGGVLADDSLGVAFAGLAAAGTLGVALALTMPETKAAA